MSGDRTLEVGFQGLGDGGLRWVQQGWSQGDPVISTSIAEESLGLEAPSGRGDGDLGWGHGSCRLGV